MKLQQYINSFTEPLRSEDPRPLIRLVDVRNKTSRGLSDTVGAIEVKLSPSKLRPDGCFSDYDLVDKLDRNEDWPIRLIRWESRGMVLRCGIALACMRCIPMRIPRRESVSPATSVTSFSPNSCPLLR